MLARYLAEDRDGPAAVELDDVRAAAEERADAVVEPLARLREVRVAPRGGRSITPERGDAAPHPLESEKPKALPVAPVFASSVDSSFLRPPGWLSTKAVASTTKPSTTAQNARPSRPSLRFISAGENKRRPSAPTFSTQRCAWAWSSETTAILLLPSRASPRLLFLLCRTSVVAAFAGRRSRVSARLYVQSPRAPRPDATVFKSSLF